MKYNVYSNGTFCKEGGFRPDTEEQENHLVRLYPQFADQTWESFGGAVTDSAGYVFSVMNPDEHDALLEAFFGENGLNYTLLRVPIDSCDFSLEQYEAAPDGDPAHFNLSRPLRYILPMLEAIRKRKPDIRLMLSPWSPPKLFKSNRQRHGGRKMPAGILRRVGRIYLRLCEGVYGKRLHRRLRLPAKRAACRPDLGQLYLERGGGTGVSGSAHETRTAAERL